MGRWRHQQLARTPDPLFRKETICTGGELSHACQDAQRPWRFSRRGESSRDSTRSAEDRRLKEHHLLLQHLPKLTGMGPAETPNNKTCRRRGRAGCGQFVVVKFVKSPCCSQKRAKNDSFACSSRCEEVGEAGHAEDTTPCSRSSVVTTVTLLGRGHRMVPERDGRAVEQAGAARTRRRSGRRAAGFSVFGRTAR